MLVDALGSRMHKHLNEPYTNVEVIFVIYIR